MVKLNKIYTRTGDDGTTGLVDGPRRRKDDLRVEAFGTVDEVNAAIGMCRLHTKDMARVDSALGRIQNDLFDLGSDLATPGPDDGRKYAALRITEKQVTWLEGQIDRHNEALEPLTSFVLPGGSPLAANCHLARTIARRAERVVVALGSEEAINPEIQRYLNRLSDLLFVLGRLANANGTKDVLWEPGRNTGTSKEG
ncbi:cob(I)yrinic acid a,c-diamide adenosyltransferase [Pelagibacterium xiamenense]|uniref:cob(I)yrinic acid a,c-diamide adenosyltransferase n=1 Tax=Pelagibacterium xiamenense TaxID=2901140 RepID=UPI001E374E46|nr:cob(I)yrinic acid a,c-diamide adenosyltransferase [Pelagibacterium xiamenense]MCD7061304.1 cob(I)yrinic acid a,c-diamide adenosyltransferase [Pelagibacterium xiamenense]